MKRITHPQYKSALLAVLASMVLAAILWFAFLKDDLQFGQPVSGAPAVPRNSDAIERAPLMAPSQQQPGEVSLEASATRGATAKLQEDLAHSGNFRAYIFENLGKPEIGGKFYASLAFFKCYRVSFVKLPTNAENNPQQQAAIDYVKNLQARCDGVSQQFGTLNEFSKLALNKGNVPDALLTKGGAVLLGIQRDLSAATQMNEALETNDSHLIALALQSNIQGLLSEGKLVASDDESDITLWLRAASAVGCELMNNCRNTEQLFVGCAVNGQCDEDLRVALRESVPYELRESYDRIVKKVSSFVGR